MKKTIMYVLLAVLSLTLSGCGTIQDIDTSVLPQINIKDNYTIEVTTDGFDLSTIITLEDDAEETELVQTSVLDYNGFDVSVLGTYDISVLVSDEDGTSSIDTITVDVVDTTPPTIALKGSNELSITVGTSYIDSGVIMLDNSNSNLEVVIVGTVNNSKVGTYVIEYYTEDESGNKSETIYRSVHVIANSPTVSIGSVIQEQDSILFTIDVIDLDNIGEITSIELYQNNTLISYLSNVTLREFSDIQGSNTYTVKVTYTYDLSGGNSTATELVVEKEFYFEQINEIDEHEFFITKDEVALYLQTYNKLPDNYMTKSEAGGHISSYWSVESMASIGGDDFGNRENLLPTATGRQYYEVDIDYDGGNRGTRRIVYSSDGFIFYTGDHYDSFLLYDPVTREWNDYSKDDLIFQN